MNKSHLIRIWLWALQKNRLFTFTSTSSSSSSSIFSIVIVFEKEESRLSSFELFATLLVLGFGSFLSTQNIYSSRYRKLLKTIMVIPTLLNVGLQQLKLWNFDSQEQQIFPVYFHFEHLYFLLTLIVD